MIVIGYTADCCIADDIYLVLDICSNNTIALSSPNFGVSSLYFLYLIVCILYLILDSIGVLYWMIVIHDGGFISPPIRL